MLQVLGKVSGVEEKVSQCKSECMCWGELVWLKDEVRGPSDHAAMEWRCKEIGCPYTNELLRAGNWKQSKWQRA